MTNNKNEDGGITEVFVTLRIPRKYYEVAYGFHRIADYTTFDEYVSDTVVKDIELMLEGQIADDLIHQKLKGKNSPWMQNQKEIWGGVNKQLKKQQKIESGR